MNLPLFAIAYTPYHGTQMSYDTQQWTGWKLRVSRAALEARGKLL